jgi:uncharacterized membrane protein
VRTLVTTLGLAYPLLVYAGLVFVGPRAVVVATGVIVALHLAAGRRRWGGADVRRALVPVVLVGGVFVAAAVVNDGRVFLFVPALVNFAMLVGFARTLYRGPSMIETFARLQRPELPASRGPYLRAVTSVWCAFFAANILVSVALACRGTLAAWTLYNGLLAYVLVGVLLAAERVYRAWHFRGDRTHSGERLDRIVRRVFPARPAGESR